MCFKSKGYLSEISDIAGFVKVERRRQRGSATLNTCDYILISIVKQLCKQQKKLIYLINSKNFKTILSNLIEVDTKISDYLFFLINYRFETDREVIECVESVEKDALRDYYRELNFNDNINNYKLIVHTIKY